MTAEIAILNKEAGAMAADSAATMSTGTGQKILTSANKVFALSKFHPVGIMIYGSAQFMGIPWETIIKLYRKQLGDDKRNTLREYAEGFIEFIKNSTALFPEGEQNDYVVGTIFSYFHFLKERILEVVEEEIEKVAFLKTKL